MPRQPALPPLRRGPAGLHGLPADGPVRKLDTSTLGPIKVDPSVDLERVERARACLNRHLPSIAAIPANLARERALAAVLEFEASERARRP